MRLRLGLLILTVACAIVLAACGGNDVDEAAPAPERTAPAAPPAPEPSAAQAIDRLPPAITGTGGTATGQPVRYFDVDPATTGYLAVPAGVGPFPAVILIHEWDGLVERVRHFADDLAERGYLVLAADLYAGRTGGNAAENRALMEQAQSDPERIIANLDAAARFLRARPDATGRIATIGWCFGGGIALSYAIGGENHDGTAIFYGRLVTDPATLRAIDHPVYGTFAAEDRGIPPSEVARFVAALRSAGVANDVHVYDDVDHGFWLYVDRQPETRARPALDAWRRLLEYLRDRLEA